MSDRSCACCAQPQGRCVRSCAVRTLLAAGLGCCNRMRVRNYVYDSHGPQLRRVTCEVHGERLYDPQAYMVRPEDWFGPGRWRLDFSATRHLQE